MVVLLPAKPADQNTFVPAYLRICNSAKLFCPEPLFAALLPFALPTVAEADLQTHCGMREP
jgi:hypothetical protein